MTLINLAIKEAKKSKHFFKVGAIIAKGKRILSRGYNSRNHCTLNRLYHTRHAEMNAIEKMLKTKEHSLLLEGATLYVARVTKTGLGISKPCPQCQALIHTVGIKKVIHT